MYDQKHIRSIEKDNSYYSSRSRPRRSFENSKSFEKIKEIKIAFIISKLNLIKIIPLQLI